MAIKYTLPELMALADRMLGRGVSVVLKDQPELQRDCLIAGRVLAHLLLDGTISQPIELEKMEGGDHAGRKGTP